MWVCKSFGPRRKQTQYKPGAWSVSIQERCNTKALLAGECFSFDGKQVPRHLVAAQFVYAHVGVFIMTKRLRLATGG